MAFYKVCVCGEKIVSEKRLGFPDNCPSCKRRIVEYIMHDDNDPSDEARNDEHGQGSNEALNKDDLWKDNQDTRENRYILQFNDGKYIEIPDEGGIVGRTEIGAEELADYPSVSRQHIRITPRRSKGVIVEDLSSYGTLIDGRRLTKNIPERALAGSKITLCNVDLVLMQKGDNE
ncbi:FHA domain-containing protein [Butyrivibrio sp.]|uniref:FHA domain-containing protein n=1 Tax=Butyrivibrio sp. TaxID=28121 RepID=UPI0025BAA046|nr:FHA domain-containing protein [Butyrivibrio sp.]MBE5838432.1 FHA domain-containing protein [Butyrivibrio sp.]